MYFICKAESFDKYYGELIYINNNANYGQMQIGLQYSFDKEYSTLLTEKEVNNLNKLRVFK